MSKTIFSKIIDREIPANIIYDDDDTLAFLDIMPLTKGHALVIPKEQVDHLDDCSEELYAKIFETVHKVSKKIRETYNPKRVGLVVHGFEIPHAHVHVVPMYTGEEMKLADRDKEKFEGDLAQVAKELYISVNE